MTHDYPTVLILFGATGDLSQKKLLPALFDLYVDGLLPDRFLIIGTALDEMDEDAFRAFTNEALQQAMPEAAADVCGGFCDLLRYQVGDFTDDGLYHTLYERVTSYNTEIGQCANVLFYLAVPPGLYETMFAQLAATESLSICAGTDAWARLLVEKPFGSDIKTAHHLEEQLDRLFADEQVYRIDHYLAKHAIENIMTLRFANPIFERIWNAACIESIHVALHEEMDIGDRGGFYDTIGALRDVGQNHLLQVVALLLMDGVDITDAQAVRAARAAVVAGLRFDATTVEPVRGQYQGYRTVAGVAAESTTETYFRFGLRSVAPAWADVAISVSAGKALSSRIQEAVITFRPSELTDHGIPYTGDPHTNELRIQLYPDSGITMELISREPGHDFVVSSHRYDLVARQRELDTPAAYERVLLDCIRGEQSRFVSAAEVQAAWRLIDVVQEALATRPLALYEPGSDAPTIST